MTNLNLDLRKLLEFGAPLIPFRGKALFVNERNRFSEKLPSESDISKWKPWNEFNDF
jgi:hypothetical protein